MIEKMQPSSSPNNSYATPPSGNNFDFIVNHSGGSNGGPSKKMRIIIVAVSAILLLIVGMIVKNILSSQGQDTFKDIASLTQAQNEIVRVAQIGIDKARSPEAKNLAVTTKQTIATDQEAMIAYLKTNKHPISLTELGMTKDPQTDELLRVAEQNNKFDTTFVQILNTELLNYQRAVKVTYQNTDGENAKALLTKTFDNINALIGEQ